MAEVGRRLVVKAKENIQLEAFDVPEPGPGQVLVRVTKSQISAGSEKGSFTREPDPDGHHLGYTLAGRVLSSGDGMEEFKLRDRVITFGSHGSHWVAGPVDDTDILRHLQKIEYDVSDEQACMTRLGDVALHSVRRATLQIDESVAVFGQGVVGQLATAFCRINGAYPVIAVDLDDHRLELSKESGATHTVNASKEDAVEAVRDIAGDGAQAVIHANREPDVLVDCLKSAARFGKVVLVGSPPGTVELGLQVELLRWELDVRGSYGAGMENNPHPYWPWTHQRDRRAIMRMIADGDLRVDHLISHVVKPEQANEVYEKIAVGPTGWMGIFFDWEST